MTTKIGELTRTGLPKLVLGGLPEKDDKGWYHCPGGKDGPCTKGLDPLTGLEDGSAYKNMSAVGLSAHRKAKHNYRSPNAERFKMELKRKHKEESKQAPLIMPKSNSAVTFNPAFLNREGKLKQQPEITFKGVKQPGFHCPVVGCDFVHSHAKWMGAHLRGRMLDGIPGHKPAIKLPIKLDPKHPPGPRGPYKVRKPKKRMDRWYRGGQDAAREIINEVQKRVAPIPAEAEKPQIVVLSGCPYCFKCGAKLKEHNQLAALQEMANATGKPRQELMTVEPEENHGQV